MCIRDSFYSTGHDSNGDGVLDTNGGWVDDAQNVDELNITLNNGSCLLYTSRG